ncbi:MAG: helix-turn-helix transcriptional regulator [Lachnospiraceae bacterium]|nr:helix-turn-helix transcriptional regulator [Lachnospiraceae bacterium]
MAENYELNFKLIGKRVREIRKRKHISQIELAELADISETYISYIECGKKKPSLSILTSIANVLDVSLDEVLVGNRVSQQFDYHTEIHEIISDCNRYEQRILFETLLSLRASLRENRPLLDKKPRRE